MSQEIPFGGELGHMCINIYYIISYHIILYHIISYYIILYYIILYLLYYIILYYNIIYMCIELGSCETQTKGGKPVTEETHKTHHKTFYLFYYHYVKYHSEIWSFAQENFTWLMTCDYLRNCPTSHPHNPTFTSQHSGKPRCSWLREACCRTSDRACLWQLTRAWVEGFSVDPVQRVKENVEIPFPKPCHSGFFLCIHIYVKTIKMDQVWVDIQVTYTLYIYMIIYGYIYIYKWYATSTPQNSPRKLLPPESNAIPTSGRASCKVPVNHQGFPPGPRWWVDSCGGFMDGRSFMGI